MTDRPITWDDTVSDPDRWDDDFKRRDLPPGAAQWGRNEEGLIKRLNYVCPCGCSEWRSVSVRQGVKVPHCWEWDGNETAPTLTPSIQHVPNKADRCNWHGFLTGGLWKTV